MIAGHSPEGRQIIKLVTADTGYQLVQLEKTSDEQSTLLAVSAQEITLPKCGWDHLVGWCPGGVNGKKKGPACIGIPWGLDHHSACCLAGLCPPHMMG